MHGVLKSITSVIKNFPVGSFYFYFFCVAIYLVLCLSPESLISEPPSPIIPFPVWEGDGATLRFAPCACLKVTTP